mgnify:CR=1 FL=1
MAKTIKKATQTKAPAKNTSVETAMKAVAAKKPEVKAAAPAPVKKTEEKPAAKAEVKPAVKETVKKAEEKVAEKKTRKPRKKTVKKPVEKIQEVLLSLMVSSLRQLPLLRRSMRYIRLRVIVLELSNPCVFILIRSSVKHTMLSMIKQKENMLSFNLVIHL